MWRWRWTVIWAVLAAAAAGAAGWLAIGPLETRHREELSRRLDAEEQRLGRRLVAEERRIENDRDRFHEQILGSGRVLLHELSTRTDGSTVDPVPASIESWAHYLELDRWAIVDESGAVRAGHSALAVKTDGSSTRWRIRPAGLYLESEVALDFPAGMRVRVARQLHDERVESWNVLGAFAWLSREGRLLARNHEASRIDAGRLRSVLDATDDRAVLTRDGEAWQGRNLTVTAGLHWIGVPRSALDTASATERRRVFFGAGMAAMIAALLAWPLSGLWMRPIAALFSALDRIVRGEADYGGLPAGRDEFAAATAWVSRLRRTLDRERVKTRAAERGAAWREVARQVAHDVKNPLAPIRLTIQNLQRARRMAPERFESDFDREAPRVLEEVARLQRLVDAFARFAELPEPQPQRFSPQGLIEELAGLTDGREDIRTRLIAAERPLFVRADPDLVRQIVHNLVSNAQQSMAATGAEGEVRLFCHDAAGFVAIVVEDDGPGFDEEARHRAGTPGFTTRPEGSGLGLAISHRLAESQGGRLEIGKAAGGGACVSLFLPADLEQHDIEHGERP
jgi:signal transduction histidine kinase